MMTERLNISYASNAFNGEKRFRIVDKFRSINTLLKKNWSHKQVFDNRLQRLFTT